MSSRRAPRARCVPVWGANEGEPRGTAGRTPQRRCSDPYEASAGAPHWSSNLEQWPKS
jgi:hypothetical protein